jgi:hypothetical protein
LTSNQETTSIQKENPLWQSVNEHQENNQGDRIPSMQRLLLPIWQE